MNYLEFLYQKSAGVTQQELVALAHKKQVIAEVVKLKKVLKKGYKTEYASVALPFDTDLVEDVLALAKIKKKLQPRILVVIGIGGSNLGAKAVQEAILGRYYNASNPMLKVYFADTVDADRMTEILRVIEQELMLKHGVLINVVTKSGSTLETILNFQTILVLLQKYRPDDYHEYVVITTDKNSKLWAIAHEEKFAVLEVPQKVGGRYSVFSAVGLFPLALLGINIKHLQAGAKAAVAACTQEQIENNPALTSSLILYHYYQQNITIHDLFIFSVDLQALGQWYRQLTGESIGKEYNRAGKKVMEGITPTVSLGSIDLHSVAQLYLGGPRDKFTTFVTVAQSNHSVTVPTLPIFEKSFPGLAGRTFEEIMDALVKGTQTAYIKNDRPFCSVLLPKKDAYSIGQFLQFKMIEMIYLGHLLEVDPFDQPNVELYKKETRRILVG